MKKTKLLVAFGSAAILLVGGVTGCKPANSELASVKVGFQGNYGAAAGMTAVTEGYFEEEGIKADYTIATGPNVAAGVLGGTLDVGFLGNGVAWNYFTENSKMKLIALDNLTDDDRLIATTAGKGKDLTLESSHADLVKALKGSKIALDLNATPGSFWSSLCGKLNGELKEGDRMWYENTDGTKLPQGLAEADYTNEGNKVVVTHMENANITAAMSKSEYDFCVSFAPVATTLAKDTAKYKVVAKTSTHMSESYTPSTWAVNSDFLKNNEETFKKFMKGLVRGMTRREEAPDVAAKAVETCTTGQTTADTIQTDIAVWLGAAKQIELCGEKTGKGYDYATNILNSAKAGGNGDKVVKTVEEAVDFSYIVEAAKATLK